jgi:predicted transcriptional regulator
MTNEPNEPISVDPNTDNLDDFTALFNGKASAKVEEVVDDNSVVEDEPIEVEDQDTPEDEPDEEVKEETDKKPKKVNAFQKRVNELLERERKANEAAAELQRKLDKVTANQKREVEQSKVQKSNTPTPEDKNPDGSDKYPLGEFDPQYLRDFNRAIIEEEWNAKKEQERVEQTKRFEQEARQQLQNQWAEKLAVVNEKYDDFVEKTIELESTFEGLDANYSDYLVQTIKSLDHGTDVLYYFANNIDEAQKFVKLGPQAATLALGEINAMFKGNTRKEAKVSKAPPPPQVNKGSKTRTTVAPDTDDLDAFSDLFFKKK